MGFAVRGSRSTAADYPATAQVHFTGVLTASASDHPSLACIRLYDVDGNVAVPNSTGCYARATDDNSYQSVDIGPFTLPDGGPHHYVIQSRVEYPPGDGFSGGLDQPAIVIAW